MSYIVLYKVCVYIVIIDYYLLYVDRVCVFITDSGRACAWVACSLCMYLLALLYYTCLYIINIFICVSILFVILCMSMRLGCMADDTFLEFAFWYFTILLWVGMLCLLPCWRKVLHSWTCMFNWRTSGLNIIMYLHCMCIYAIYVVC